MGLRVAESEARKCTTLVIFRLLDFPKSPSLLDMSMSSLSRNMPPLLDYHRLNSNTVLTVIYLFEVSRVHSVSSANQKV